jgi:hypothetical protein
MILHLVYIPVALANFYFVDVLSGKFVLLVPLFLPRKLIIAVELLCQKFIMSAIVITILPFIGSSQLFPRNNN